MLFIADDRWMVLYGICIDLFFFTIAGRLGPHFPLMQEEGHDNTT
jgi:hypothetical protein